MTLPYYQRNNHLVWDETCHIMLDLFDNVWGDKDEIRVDHCAEVTVQVRPCYPQIPEHHLN